MIITTTDTIPNQEISEILGICRGSTVRARNIGKDIFAGLKNIIGGEIQEYTKLQADSREEAIQRLKRSLSEFVIEGITTTIDLHKKILSHKKFINSDFDVNWLVKENFC